MPPDTPRNSTRACSSTHQYLISVHIIEMADDEWMHMVEYLRSLRWRSVSLASVIFRS